MERETGIEPAQSAWKAEVLPLNYSRLRRERLLRTCTKTLDRANGGRWIRTTEGVSQQIYSLPPLAAWVSLRTEPAIVGRAGSQVKALIEDSAPGAGGIGQRVIASRNSTTASRFGVGIVRTAINIRSS